MLYPFLQNLNRNWNMDGPCGDQIGGLALQDSHPDLR